jgi:hypothetical protein
MRASYMFEFSVSKDMKEKDIISEVVVGKVVAYLCLTWIVKELKIIVEHGRVVTILYIIKHQISDLMSDSQKKIGVSLIGLIFCF